MIEHIAFAGETRATSVAYERRRAGEVLLRIRTEYAAAEVALAEPVGAGEAASGAAITRAMAATTATRNDLDHDDRTVACPVSCLLPHTGNLLYSGSSFAIGAPRSLLHADPIIGPEGTGHIV